MSPNIPEISCDVRIRLQLLWQKFHVLYEYINDEYTYFPDKIKSDALKFLKSKVKEFISIGYNFLSLFNNWEEFLSL